MLKKLEAFNAAVARFKWSVWFWALVIIIPVSFLLTAYDGIRLLLGIVPPADYERAIDNVAIRGAAVVVLTPIWYFMMYRPWKREREEKK